jgi:hypothetical protein
MMGGTLTLESALGVGSTFRIELPLKVEVGAEVPPSSVELPEPLTVLLVDDNATSRAALQGTLADLELDVRAAGSQTEALELAAGARRLDRCVCGRSVAHPGRRRAVSRQAAR